MPSIIRCSFNDLRFFFKIIKMLLSNYLYYDIIGYTLFIKLWAVTSVRITLISTKGSLIYAMYWEHMIHVLMTSLHTVWWWRGCTSLEFSSFQVHPSRVQHNSSEIKGVLGTELFYNFLIGWYASHLKCFLWVIYFFLVYICDQVQQKVHLVGQVYSEIMNKTVCKI